MNERKKMVTGFLAAWHLDTIPDLAKQHTVPPSQRAIALYDRAAVLISMTNAPERLFWGVDDCGCGDRI